MGDKMSARITMRNAGVPVIPGEEIETEDEEEALLAIEQASTRVGYPLLLKASSGGGGKGMRAVDRPEDLLEAARSARREALASFGDGRVYLERLLTGSKHVEIQILADRHGRTIHLGERECSVQRRHQKVFEEAPCPTMTEEIRSAMGKAAVAAAMAVNYEGAGTVEFLLAPTGEFFFLEMNTRIQVEHPVTEMITGVDIVESSCVSQQVSQCLVVNCIFVDMLSRSGYMQKMRLIISYLQLGHSQYSNHLKGQGFVWILAFDKEMKSLRIMTRCWQN